MLSGAALRRFATRLRRLVTTPYDPVPAPEGFLSRAQRQEGPAASVTVAVPTGTESRRYFGVDLQRHGIQPVFLRIENRATAAVRLQMVSIDRNYFTPLEAAARSHFSVVRRLSAFGFMGWLFLPLLPLVPLKLITAWINNGRMDDLFRDRAFPLGAIAPGQVAEGFVFTTLDLGTKAVHVRLAALRGFDRILPAAPADDVVVDYVFTVPVPGITADYLGRDFTGLRPAAAVEACTADALVARLESLPPATTNAAGSRAGDPVNLVLIGAFDALLAAFAARWDESESITLATCWKTVRAFLWGTNYRYSPVSPLHLFGREQDIALQRTRRSINERLHLRLWLTPLDYEGRPVWVGQVSRDIGVRFTTRAWNLATHRIDPNVDESRDYAIEDLTLAGRIEAVGYVRGVGACDRSGPRRNLTGDPYFTDGNRAVILLARHRRDTGA
ncbi:MAG: hypothetical protein EBX36_07375 [Planctomycetia bacterium]|nr:hypothetical protein [Planctomycetia bacterium]